MPVKKYLNFDLEVQRADEQYRSRVIDSPQGQGSTNFEQPFSLRELADSLGLVGGELRRVLLHKVNGADKLAVYDPVSFGTRLYQLVFSGEVGEMLRSSMADAEAKGYGLRIRLRLNEAPE